MNKVAEYLQEHITGEISSQPALLTIMSRDASILEVKPEMVMYPRLTSDIRKVARFSWQLAEKGHLLPLTARGDGTDTTGAAIGKGMIINTSAHMNTILEFDLKQKLIRLQPGLGAKSLNDALALHGMTLPALVPYGTLGGAVADNSYGLASGKYGDMRSWVYQLEVVLANGDVLQTERINKRELNRRKGLQTFEGEIYRTLDSLIEDSKELIEEKIGSDSYDASGYGAIAKVKQRDGSFDLTPLFIGSQGTLGIISEMIVKADFVSTLFGVAVAAFSSKEIARDALDQLKELEPAFLDYFDGAFYQIAEARGRKYGFSGDTSSIGAVVVIGFADFNERTRRKKLKKVAKYFSKAEASFEVADGSDAEVLLAAREVTSFVVLPNESGASAPPLFDGVYMPPERFEDFSQAVSKLAEKYHVTLPLHLNALDNFIYTRPVLQFHKVSEKQKALKLIDEFNTLVVNNSGYLVAQGGEGRLKATLAIEQLDDDVKELYASVKAVFDPYTILNPGVKQANDMRQLANLVRKDYDHLSPTGFLLTF